ncbi:VOC family protein [Massilia kyonggiensis]|jgi:predicted enzyme related to lactoylglutathione lyase|nr:VOC family protein [Massilia kyonggiensis]
MERNVVGWFEIYVDDMKRARAFYETVFEAKLENLAPEGSEAPGGLEMWAFTGDPNAGGAAGSIVKMEGCKAGGNSTIVYFSCADCAVEAARAAANGGRIFKDKFSIGQYGHIALVEDTEGNIIGLHSMN